MQSEVNQEENLNRIITVSYTHLDVYKRQVAGVRIVCAFIDDIYMISDLITQQDDIKVIEIKMRIQQPAETNSSISVSYTHLDVYKRQVLE